MNAARKEKPGVMLYWEVLDTLLQLPPEANRSLLSVIYQFARYGTEPEELTFPLNVVWPVVRSGVQRDNERYDRRRAAAAAAGQKSARKRAEEAQQAAANANEAQRIATNVNETQRIATNVNEIQRIATNVNETQRISTNVNEAQRTSTNVNESQQNQPTTTTTPTTSTSTSTTATTTTTASSTSTPAPTAPSAPAPRAAYSDHGGKNLPPGADGAGSALGRYGNVFLSQKDMAALQAEYPADWEGRIEQLSEYIASTGRQYRDHLATIRSWARKEKHGTVRLSGTHEAADRFGKLGLHV